MQHILYRLFDLAMVFAIWMTFFILINFVLKVTNFLGGDPIPPIRWIVMMVLWITIVGMTMIALFPTTYNSYDINGGHIYLWACIFGLIPPFNKWKFGLYTFGIVGSTFCSLCYLGYLL